MADMTTWRTVAIAIGRNIERERRTRGMTQSALVERMRDRDIANFRRVERGRRNVTLSTLVAVADALGVEVSVLLRL